MKQIMFLMLMFGLIALSIAGHHRHHHEFKVINTIACNTTTKITESQWSALLACGRNHTNKRFADFHAAVLANCSSAANETEIQVLKIAGNDEQNKAVNEMCSENYHKCKWNYMKSAKKDHKMGDHKNGEGDDEHKKKGEQFKQKMDKMMLCSKTAVGITTA